MTTNDRFGTLQARWAAGEALSADEERERLESAVGDPLAERELALFDALKARGEGADPLPRGFIERVLDAAGARPRLHLLSPGARPPVARKPPARARRIALAAAASLVVGGVALFAMLFRAKPAPEARLVVPNAVPRSVRAELVLASGDVTLPGGARVGGKPFAPGDRLSTGEGRACLGIDPGIDVCLGARSEIYVESLRAESVRLRVERGTALAALTRREPGHEFSLTTESVTVTARGTVFAVERRAGHELDVVVMEGTVEVAAPSSPPALVAAHSRLAVGESERGEPEAIGRGDEARFWALLAARELWAKPELGVLEVAPGEAGLEVAVDRAAPLTLPFRGFVPAGRRSIALRSASGGEVTTSVDIVAGETFVLDPREHFPREPFAKPASIEETTSVPSAATLLARARKELAGGNARGALALYEKLRSAHPASPEARTVLVTIGKLELDFEAAGTRAQELRCLPRGAGSPRARSPRREDPRSSRARPQAATNGARSKCTCPATPTDSNLPCSSSDYKYCKGDDPESRAGRRARQPAHRLRRGGRSGVHATRNRSESGVLGHRGSGSRRGARCA